MVCIDHFIIKPRGNADGPNRCQESEWERVLETNGKLSRFLSDNDIKWLCIYSKVKMKFIITIKLHAKLTLTQRSLQSPPLLDYSSPPSAIQLTFPLFMCVMNMCAFGSIFSSCAQIIIAHYQSQLVYTYWIRCGFILPLHHSILRSRAIK